MIARFCFDERVLRREIDGFYGECADAGEGQREKDDGRSDNQSVRG